MTKRSSHVSELKYAKVERRYMSIRLKPLRKAAAKAERRAAKHELRNLDLD